MAVAAYLWFCRKTGPGCCRWTYLARYLYPEHVLVPWEAKSQGFEYYLEKLGEVPWD